MNNLPKNFVPGALLKVKWSGVYVVLMDIDWEGYENSEEIGLYLYNTKHQQIRYRTWQKSSIGTRIEIIT